MDGFKRIFKRSFRCSKAVAFTDKFTVEGCETLCMVEPNAEVEIFGLPKEDPSGLVRSECKFGDKTGWITIKQNKGSVYLTPLASFKVFSARMDKALADGSSAVDKAMNSISAKMKHGSPAADGTLGQIREEFVKLKEEVSKTKSAMAELKTTTAKAKAAFLVTEQAEANAHTEAKNMKEAAPFLDAAKEVMQVLEADAKAAEETSAPIVTLTGEALEAFATPASVLEKMEELGAAVVEKAKEARETIKEKMKAAADAPQTGGTGEAKKQLKQMMVKLEDAARKTQAKLAVVKGKCKALVDAKVEPTAEAIRKHVQQKKMTPDALFTKLKKGDKIPEAAFCKFLESLEGVSVSPEAAKLVCRRVETDGISRDVFLKYVVLYYKVVKTIAFTDDMDITKCKTLQKGEEGEVVEVIEGPVEDEANGLLRIKGKSVTKPGSAAGWLSVSGSKGTVFLKKCEKP